MLAIFDACQRVADLIHRVAHIVDNPSKTCNYKELPLESADYLSNVIR